MDNLTIIESYLEFHNFIINCESDLNTSRVVAVKNDLVLIIDVEGEDFHEAKNRVDELRSNEGKYLRVRDWKDLSLYLSTL